MSSPLSLRISRVPGPWSSPFLAVMVAACLTACGGGGNGTGPDDDNGNPDPIGLPACPSTPFLTVSPIPIESIREVGPLGFLNPPGHTFPGQHMGFLSGRDPATGGTLLADLRAPADIRITEVVANHFEFPDRTSPGDTIRMTDHTLIFFACADVRFYFGHVSGLTPALETEIGAFDDSQCNPPYTTGDLTNTQCKKTVSIDVSAGTILGTMGGPLQGGMDFGAADRRVTPPPWANPGRIFGFNDDWGAGHVVCATNYLVASVWNVLKPLVGWAGRPRTAEPVCGEYAQDIPGTAQGRWYFDNTIVEDPHLALVHDMADPSIGVFSVGTSIPSVASGRYHFAPASTGQLNLDFPQVLPGSGVLCYEFQSGGVWWSLEQVVFLELTSGGILRVEGRPGAACGDPATWGFTSGVVEFQR